MPKVIIDMTMSLDGYVAGPEDGPEFPLGRHDGMAIFDWYFSGTEEYRTPLFKPEPGPNLDQVKRMYAKSGAFIFGRRTYDITKGWGGRHPVNGVPVLVLTHNPPPAETVPKGPSNLTFITDGIESAIRQAKASSMRSSSISPPTFSVAGCGCLMCSLAACVSRSSASATDRLRRISATASLNSPITDAQSRA